MVKRKRGKWVVLLLFLCFCSNVVPCNASCEPDKDVGFLRIRDQKKSYFENACKWDFKKRWPSNPKGPTLVLGFLMTRTGFAQIERLGLKIPGMMTYAVEEVNRRGILPKNYTLQVEVRDTKGEELTSTRYVTDLICDQISGFIGPESSCWVEASIAEAMNIPMISYACTDERAADKTTFARTNPSEIHILRATLDTLVHFNWNRFSIIHDDTGSYGSMATTLDRLAKKRNLTVNHKVPFKSNNEFPSIFSATKEDTRIYVLISHRRDVSKVLLAMTLCGLLKANRKEYFLIYIDIEEFKGENWAAYIFEAVTVDKLQKSSKCLPKDMKAYENGFMVIANTLPKDTSGIENKTREYNKREPFCLASDVTNIMNRRDKGVLSRLLDATVQHVPFLPASHLYDAVMLYAIAVRELYEDLLKQNNGTLDVEAIGRNGTGIAQKLANRTFPSILGFNVTMGSDRASEGSYSIYYFKKDIICQNPKYQHLLNCTSQCLVKLSDIKNRRLNTSEIIDILDEPVCGYRDVKCQPPVAAVRHIILGVLASAMFLLSLFTFLQYRHWKYELEISGLSWRINKEELVLNIHNYISRSRISITSVDCNFQTLISPERMAEYRGTTCCLKCINLENKKQDLNRKVMKQMKSMREMKHRNVCSFIGAYVHDRRLTLVTEYANRGSLEDILQNTDIKLDELFISSLVKDLLRAMIFLHSSFGPHGNLKSNNCVVTGRWVLQVTDYDLYEIRYEAVRCLMKEPCYEGSPEWMMYVKSLLWRAPELLRLDPATPGTREGDVYSFGIILHEIVARLGPYSTYYADYVDYEAVIDELKSGSTKSGSLRRPDTLDMVMNPFGIDPDVKFAMESAWAEDPKARPEFKELSTRLKKFKKSHGNLMDHMVLILEGHNKNLEERVAAKTCELREEKKRSEELLHSMLPEEVARSICSNIEVPPKSFDSVTIYFSDIVGFTSLASESSPIQIFQFLDDLYREFDNTIRGFDVYKVETIGDAYMVVSGLPDSKKKVPHAGAIASMALELLEKTKSFKIRHIPDHKLKLRIGLHTGPVIAGVVGKTMPRYCLFGDTVNMASRMESNGSPLRIHISESCKDALSALGGYIVEKRDKITVKGKGLVQTYWLNDTGKGAIKRREIIPETIDTDMIRRRSPRLSTELRTPRLGAPRRTASIIRSVSEIDDLCPTPHSESPPKDLAEHHYRRLSNTLKTSTGGAAAVDHIRTSLNSCADQLIINRRITQLPMNDSDSRSLDRFPFSSVVLPATDDDVSPSVSQPTLTLMTSREDGVEEDQGGGDSISPRVNFSTLKDEEINEAQPMLVHRSCADDSPPVCKRDSLRAFLQAIFPKARRERLNSEKSSLNGLQRESHV